MKNLIRSIVFVFALTVAGVMSAGPTPRATVQSFLIAAKGGSVEGVKKCLKDGHKLGNGDSTGIAAMQLFFRGARITRVENVNRFHAVVYVRITNPLTGESEESPMSVKKINGDWKIGD